MRSATDTAVYTVREDVTTSVSIDRVTRMPTGFRAWQSPAAAGRERNSGATTTEDATGAFTKAQSSTGTCFFREDEKKYVIEKLVRRHCTKRAMHYRDRRYSYTSRKATTSPPIGYRIFSLTATVEQLRRSDKILVDRNGDNTTHNILVTKVGANRRTGVKPLCREEDMPPPPSTSIAP